MNIVAQSFALAVSLLALVLVFLMLRRKSFRERHAVWWIVASLGAVFVSLFPGLISWLATLLGVAEPLNLVFFLSTSILFLVAVQFSTEITATEARVRRLAEETALRDLQVRQLEDEIAELRRRIDS